MIVRSPRNLQRRVLFFSWWALLAAPGICEWTPLVPKIEGPEPPQFAQIYALQEKGRWGQALELYLEIAEQNPGTADAAECLSQAALMAELEGDAQRGRTFYQEVIDKFPGTGYEVFAREELEVRNGTLEETMATRSAIGLRFGAPSLEEILAPGDQAHLIEQVTALHPDIRRAIGKLYGIHSVFVRHRRFDEALRLANFGRQAFDQASLLGDAAYASGVNGILIRMANGPIPVVPGSLASVPNLTVFPAQGQIVPMSTPVTVTVSTGDYRHARLMLEATEFTLDGQDRTYDLRTSTAQRFDLTPDVDFEVVTLTLDPPLAVGQHTATIKVRPANRPQDPPGGPGYTTVTWSFTVSDTPPPDPDPTTETRSSTKDALVYEKSPHSNEGANPRLTLEKINGKAARNLLSFNLSGARRFQKLFLGKSAIDLGRGLMPLAQGPLNTRCGNAARH